MVLVNTMVIQEFFILLEGALFRITIGIAAAVLLFFILTIGFSWVGALKRKIRTRISRKIHASLIGYLLEETAPDCLRCKRMQRNAAIDAFATVLLDIKGRKRVRMKEAAVSLGLVRYIEKGLGAALSSKRMRSSHTLGILGSRHNVQRIIRVLSDSNPKVVSAAIIALGELRDERAVSNLLRLYGICPLSQAWLIAAILPFFGPGIYPHLKPLILDPSYPPSRTILLVKVISGLRLTESLEVLQRLYGESGSLDVRINALIAIGKINDLFAVKTVIDALSDTEWQVRAVACNLIGDMAIKGAVDRLAALLTDESWFVRKNSAAALVQLGSIGIMELINTLNGDDRYAKDMVVQTLQEQGVFERILRHLGGGDERRKKTAYRVVRFLSRKGYRNYLENYRDLFPVIEELLQRVG